MDPLGILSSCISICLAITERIALVGKNKEQFELLRQKIAEIEEPINHLQKLASRGQLPCSLKSIQALHRTLERIEQWCGQGRFRPRTKRIVKALSFLSDLYHSSDDADKFREFSDLISSHLESLNLHITVRLLDFSTAAAKDATTAGTGSTKPDSMQLTLIDKKLLTWEPLKASNKLGQGGFSTVTIGMYKNEYVAIKHVQHLEQMSEKDIKMVTKEAMIMQFADHPNIVSLKGVHLTQGLLVMELALCSLADYLHQTTPLAQERGKPLRTAITTTTGTSNLNWKLGIIRDVADAIQYLHSFNILHRDIKSPNILLFLHPSSGKTIAKVADFGVALAVELVSRTAGTIRSSSGSNTAQRAVGTYNYMAPELFDRHPGESIAYSEASDVYSLGILVNEIMTERIPWVTGREYDIKDWVLREELRPTKWVLPLTSSATVTTTTASTEEEISIALHRLVGDSDALHCCWSQRPIQRCTAMEIFLAVATNITPSTTTSASPLYTPIKPEATVVIYPALSIPPCSVSTASSGEVSPNHSENLPRPILSVTESLLNSTSIGSTRNLPPIPLPSKDSSIANATTCPMPPSPLSAVGGALKSTGIEQLDRSARHLKAQQPQYEYHRYSNLRTADDYIQGLLKGQSTAKENFLTFQSSTIHKSLTVLSSEESRLAVQVHWCLLAHMGDINGQPRAEATYEMLQLGYSHSGLRDEIYLQIIKQMSDNPRPESVAEGWLVMCMCVGTFPPSPEFENFLLHFIIRKSTCGRGAVCDYAKYCLRNLEAMRSCGGVAASVPSVEEILAYKKRPPILATIYLVDGTVIMEDLSLTPDLNVAKVLEMCIGRLDLKDPRINTLGMFVYDLGRNPGRTDLTATAAYADLQRTPRLLRNSDYMGDAVVQKSHQRRLFKFVVKRKLFSSKDNYRGEDALFERLTYLQAEDEVITVGNLEPNTMEQAQRLAALSMAWTVGRLPESVGEIMDVGVVNYVPPKYRTARTPREWAEALLQLRESLSEDDPVDLQRKVLQIAQECPMYGAHWFYIHLGSVEGAPDCITQLPKDLVLAFNMDGMHIHTVNRHHMYYIPYIHMRSWSGTADQLSVKLDWGGTKTSKVLQEYDMVLVTAQAQDIAAVIIAHIEFSMQK